MPKAGLHFPNIKPILLGARNGWALCVGAGASLGPFPNWFGLVQKLFSKKFGNELGPELAMKLSQKFSLDALIQSTQNMLELGDSDFANVIRNELYEALSTRTKKSGDWKLIEKALCAKDHMQLSVPEWKKVVTTFKREYPSVSSLAISKVVVSAMHQCCGPKEILSFNAEPLLYMLLNAHVSLLSGIKKSGGYEQQYTSNQIDQVTRSIQTKYSDHVQYYFCHGLLSPDRKKQGSPMGSSEDKLVFSEGAYLQLANSAFSWQSSVAYNIFLNRTVVFVGLSLSDQNMRRWLTWIQLNHLDEIAEVSKVKAKVSTSHFWINESTGSDEENLVIEAAVAHLGVKLIWLNSWAELEKALEMLLGLKSIAPKFFLA